LPSTGGRDSRHALAAMDLSAFEQFNRDLWRRPDCFDLNALGRPGPVMIGGLIRSKTVGRRVARGGAISVYYTFIGEDAKTQLNEWLKERRQMLQKAGQADSDFLFLNWRRGGRQSFRSSLVPVTGNTIGKMVTSLIKKLDLVNGVFRAKMKRCALPAGSSINCHCSQPSGRRKNSRSWAA